MSDEHHNTSASTGAATQQNLVLRTVIIACAVVVVLAFVLIKFTLPSDSTTAVDPAAEIQAKAQRLQKVGTIAIRPADRPLRSGQEVYDTQCFACHATGISDAPKFADKAQWAPRIAQGFDTLLHSAVQGKGLMPPQAGGQVSEYEIARAVVYMANEAGANFPEPTPPADAQ